MSTLINRVVAAVPDAPDCACDQCKRMCRNPCRPTPAEAKRMIEAGLGALLTTERFYGKQGAQWQILRPRRQTGTSDVNEPMFGWYGPFTLVPDDKCSFLTRDGLCSLHGTGLKPFEGRTAHHSDKPHNDCFTIAGLSWRTPEGRAVLQLWKEKYESAV